MTVCGRCGGSEGTLENGHHLLPLACISRLRTKVADSEKRVRELQEAWWKYYGDCKCDLSAFSTIDCMHTREATAVFGRKPQKA